MNVKMITIGLLLLATLVTGKTTLYYRAQYTTAAGQAAERQQAIDDMHRRQLAVAALDEKLMGELVDAQKNIDQLQRDVNAGRRRLQFNASCTKPVAGTAAARLADAARPRPDNAAERDYFTLRERIELSKKMIEGLQQYIREQCPK